MSSYFLHSFLLHLAVGVLDQKFYFYTAFFKLISVLGSGKFQIGKLLGEGSSHGLRDINTVWCHHRREGEAMGGKMLVHSIFLWYFHTHTHDTLERAKGCTVKTLKCRQATSGVIIWQQVNWRTNRLFAEKFKFLSLNLCCLSFPRLRCPSQTCNL